ncbi:MAG TPA: serine hydrolase domain-containing protein, partial [Chitinophagaceae bacterium]|nr:serine hydrolase domain-containing protein [Chitinophagaceae bacterium]
MLRTHLTIALLLAVTVLQGQTGTRKAPAPGLAEKIDQYLLSATGAHRFNGSALVEQDGKILLHKAYGWKDFSRQSLNDTGTRFPILSITKSFTATVLLKLQEQGLLSLKDPLRKYFPDYPEGDKILLEHLLTH